MMLRFHCDYCATPYETADACGKCERTCLESINATLPMLRRQRSDCHCPCHAHAHVNHVLPCCFPDVNIP